MDFNALRDEIINDPAKLGYSGLSPAEIVNLLAVTMEQVECFVPLKDLQSMLMETVVAPAPVPVWWVLKSAVGSNKLAEMAFDMFSSRLDNFNSRGAFQSVALAQMQGAGLINETVRGKIDAMAVKSIPRGEHLFGRVPNVLEVQFALLPE